MATKIKTTLGRNGKMYSEYSISEGKTIILSDEEFDTIEKVEDFVFWNEASTNHMKKEAEILTGAKEFQEESDFEKKFGHNENA